LTTETYRSLNSSDQSSGLIGRFLRRALLDERLGASASAAEHVLCAAWAADDVADPSARAYRSRAADLFKVAASKLPEGSEEAITMHTRTVDILRRAERWAEAVDLADKILATGNISPPIRSVVEFGRKQSLARRNSGYTIAEALPDSASRSEQ